MLMSIMHAPYAIMHTQFVPEYRDQFVPKRPGWLDALVGGGGSSTESSE